MRSTHGSGLVLSVVKGDKPDYFQFQKSRANKRLAGHDPKMWPFNLKRKTRCLDLSVRSPALFVARRLRNVNSITSAIPYRALTWNFASAKSIVACSASNAKMHTGYVGVKYGERI